MASSAQNHHGGGGGGATSAPPPTPSAQPSSLLSATAEAADALSRLLHRHLPPALALPTARRAANSAAAMCPPLVSLSDETATTALSLFTSSSQLGFFQLTDHSVPSQLARSAESEALSNIFDLSRDKKVSLFPKNWPFGYEGDDDDEDDGESSFCLDSACAAESDELSLPRLRELTRELERVGLRIVELLAGSVGFERPKRLCTLTWLSEDSPGKKAVSSGGFYPYVVGLEYQIRARRYSLLADSGWVSVLPRVDSVLVTIGDIAQVWSNGKLKKVRGRPVASSGDHIDHQGINNNNNNKSRSISMSVLITLPLDSTVSPLTVPKELSTVDGLSNILSGHNLEDGLQVVNEEEEEEISSENKVNEIGTDDSPQKEKRLFKSFSFEDYAWRVYHERLPLKDPLDRYRIKK